MDALFYCCGCKIGIRPTVRYEAGAVGGRFRGPIVEGGGHFSRRDKTLFNEQLFYCLRQDLVVGLWLVFAVFLFGMFVHMVVVVVVAHVFSSSEDSNQCS